MGFCQRCGGYCANNYTYCKPCYIALGTPYGTSISKDISAGRVEEQFMADTIIARIAHERKDF